MIGNYKREKIISCFVCCLFFFIDYYAKNNNLSFTSIDIVIVY